MFNSYSRPMYLDGKCSVHGDIGRDFCGYCDHEEVAALRAELASLRAERVKMEAVGKVWAALMRWKLSDDWSTRAELRRELAALASHSKTAEEK